MEAMVVKRGRWAKFKRRLGSWFSGPGPRLGGEAVVLPQIIVTEHSDTDTGDLEQWLALVSTAFSTSQFN